MPVTIGRLRPLLRVGLPVALAAVFVWLAIINIALVKTYQAALEDGVLWHQEGSNVVAAEVAPVRARYGHMLDQRAEIGLAGQVMAIAGQVHAGQDNLIVTFAHKTLHLTDDIARRT